MTKDEHRKVFEILRAVVGVAGLQVTKIVSDGRLLSQVIK